MNENRLSVRMTRKEILIGMCYLPAYLLLISVTIQMLLYWFAPDLLTDPMLNACHYGVNILCVLAIFHRFLWENFRVFATKWKSVLFQLPAALGIYYLLAMAVNMIVLFCMPDFINQNNETLVGILEEQPLVMIVIAIVLAPIIEEVIFRGLIFSNLQATNRIFAYAFTALFFAAIHIVGYLSTMTWQTVVLSFAQYVPATLVLARFYEKTDTIIAPMLLHAAVNTVACLWM